MGRRLFITPKEVKVFCGFYKYRAPQKEKYSVMFIDIDTQQKEQYYVMFINQSPTIHQQLSRNQPNGLWPPLLWSLSRTPPKGTILCDVYKSIANYPPKIVKLEELTWIQLMYWWRQVKSQKTAPSPRPSKNMWGKQIYIFGLDTAHWKSANKPEERFQD